MDVTNLEPLIAPRLGSGKKITNIETSVSELQGHGSVMLKVKVTVQDQNGREETLHLVAKRLPESEEMRESFDIQVSFKKEVQFYNVILPILETFQMEEGVTDISKHFAKFYGARYNLNGTDDIVDDDGTLILEDLCVKGFGNFNPTTGFDLNTAEVILRDLANFHGTVIALKLKKPEIFEQRIKPLCIPFNFQKDNDIVSLFKTLKELIETFPDYSIFAHNATNFIERDPPKRREPYSTINQCDLWVKNIMNKIGHDKSVENVFVDFQLFDLRSSAVDVFFFLWTSVEEEVLKNKIDHLLKHYHRSLLNRLEEFRLDISAFSYEKFEEELRVEADYEFGHSLIFVIFLKLRESDDMDDKEWQLQMSDFTPDVKNFIHFMVAECVKRKWLY